MNDSLYNTKEYLPKCWIAKIAKYWEKIMPTGYPKSSSSFLFVTDAEDKAAVIDMEEKLGTDESIIDPESVPENMAVGSYLGAYDVVANVGEVTLLSPNKLPDNMVDALVYHYDKDSDEWTLVENTEVRDGYVWGALESFSPIAVFGIRRDTVFMENLPGTSNPGFICNGIPVKIYTSEEDNQIYAEDGFGVVKQINQNCWVIGGSIDGSKVESTSVTVIGAHLDHVIGGSMQITSEGTQTRTPKITINIIDSTIKTVSGAGLWDCADEVEINISNSEINDIGCQMTYYSGSSSNHTLNDSKLRLGANQWVKHSVIKAVDSKISVLYAAGNNGFSYTDNAELYATNCECDYICNGQSNGTVGHCYTKAVNCKVNEALSTINCGAQDSADTVLVGCTINNGFILADPADEDEVAELSGQVSYDIDAATAISNFDIGRTAVGIVETHDEAKQYVKYCKVSRDAAMIYANNADKILDDILVIK